eukprot:TRINITY_DN6276_c0_g1_i1.p1 TRINITY_DN6276_c0_g1~~TRINITY_DN6276_c0_g1_i1.p1  ORF type:complete len:414 (-),score=43.03 TRINITY_DN6276_c0_g1_i1:45-1286(-)
MCIRDRIYAVILGHELNSSIALSMNVEDFPDIAADPNTAYFYGAEFAVDVFFYLSGFFFVFIFFKKFRNKAFGIKEFFLTFLHRLIRILPAYLVLILITWKLLQFIGNGPFWSVIIDMLQQNCQNKAWTDIVFLNNFFTKDTSEDCIGWGWYLGCDMQLFLMMTLVSIVVLKHNFLGKTLLWILLITSLIYSYFLALNLGFSALGTNSPYFSQAYYFPPWTRGPPYILGMLVALWYIEEKGKITKFFARSRILQIISSFLGLYTMHYVVAFIKPMLRDPNYYSPEQSALYISLSRTAFVAGMTAFLLPGFVGAKLLKNVLGNKFFETTAKLNFSTYLIHAVIIVWKDFNSRSSFFLSFREVFYRSLTTTVFSFGIALVLHILVELPFSNLEQILFRDTKKSCLLYTSPSPRDS